MVRLFNQLAVALPLGAIVVMDASNPSGFTRFALAYGVALVRHWLS